MKKSVDLEKILQRMQDEHLAEHQKEALKREAALRVLEKSLILAGDVVFKNRCFMFTEPFNFGSREQCAAAVMDRGGIFMDKKRPTPDLNYLVLGEKNAEWMDGDLVGKIERGLELIMGGCPLRLITESEFVIALNESQVSEEKGFITHNSSKLVRKIIYNTPLPEPKGLKCTDVHVEYLQGYIDSIWAWRKIWVELPFDFNDLTTNQFNSVAKDLLAIRRNPAGFEWFYCKEEYPQPIQDDLQGGSIRTHFFSSESEGIGVRIEYRTPD